MAFARTGRLAAAQDMANDVLAHIETNGTRRFVEPVLLLRGLATIYHLADESLAHARVLAIAEEMVDRAAALIRDETVRGAYLWSQAPYLAEMRAEQG